LTRLFNIVMVRPQGVIAPFVNDDIQIALEELGHSIYLIDIAKVEEEFKVRGMPVWNEIIAEIREFKADFSVCYGMSGAIVFEGEHQGEEHILRSLNIPLFPMFFDDPVFTLNCQPGLVLPKDELFFVWDKGHIERMRERGYKKVFHLPLGCNENKFKPLKKPQGRFSHQMSFVGSIASPDEILEPIKKAEMILQNIFETVVRRRMEKPERALHLILDEVANHLSTAEWESWKLFEKTKAYWVFVDRLHRFINAIWREQIVTSMALNDLPISVYGNDAWKDMKVDFKGHLDYHKQLPRLYASCPLHLNLSAPQLFTTVNNRVFDVLACGSMVLSDWREELGDYFEEGKEILVFHTVEEAVEMAKEWIGRDEALRKMAQVGRQRVLAEHTWKKRMTDALAVIAEEL
jgi:spore maturation protein CgeB